MPHYPDEIEYSDKYMDDYYEYRHVILPREVYKKMPRSRLLLENEWRAIGVQQSRGWVHYELHRPEPHILLFRRAKGSDPQTGLPPPGFVAPPDAFAVWFSYYALSYLPYLLIFFNIFLNTYFNSPHSLSFVFPNFMFLRIIFLIF